MPSSAARNLLPGSLVALARGSALADFESACGARHVALIRVGDPEGDLARVLAASFERAPRVSEDPPVLGFQTDLVDPAYFERLEARLEGMRAFDENDLARWLGAGPCFAAPLAKRSGGGAFRERITAGRARNQDLVLRAPSVSKLHCWFELASDAVQLVDADSTNGTLINNRPLTPRVPVPVLWGDLISIGSVECTLSGTAAFWRVARA